MFILAFSIHHTIFENNLTLFELFTDFVSFQFLDSERIKLVVLQWCILFFYFLYILYTKFLPDRVLRFQHMVPYLLANWIKMVL